MCSPLTGAIWTYHQFFLYLWSTIPLSRFIPDFSEFAVSLTELTKMHMSIKVNWTLECQRAFDALNDDCSYSYFSRFLKAFCFTDRCFRLAHRCCIVASEF